MDVTDQIVVVMESVDMASSVMVVSSMNTEDVVDYWDEVGVGIYHSLSLLDLNREEDVGYMFFMICVHELREI